MEVIILVIAIAAIWITFGVVRGVLAMLLAIIFRLPGEVALDYAGGIIKFVVVVGAVIAIGYFCNAWQAIGWFAAFAAVIMILAVIATLRSR